MWSSHIGAYIVGTTLFEFSKCLQKGGSDFSHKKGGVGEIVGVVLKKDCITYFHTK